MEEPTMEATAIYYFSGTGNSLVVARTIAAKLGNTKLIPIAREGAMEPLVGAQRVGLVFPIYVFGLPLIVTRFITKLKIPNDTYVFAVAVNGGMPCATLKQTATLFAEHGRTLSSGFAVTMVDNYTPISGAISLKKQKQRFAKAGRKVEEICGAIERRDRGVYPGWLLVNWLFSRMYRGWVPDAPNLDKNFAVDSNCNGCGVCEKVCPVRNIKMNDRLPTWQHHCEQCFACLHWCPNHAIQYGKRTAGRTRYHHPDVAIADIVAQRASGQ
jgi:ferredoxin